METNSTYYIVAVKDELTGTFLQPTFGENIEALKRIFATQINTIAIWKENASDFSFYQLGLFDQETGRIVSDVVKLVSGHSVLRKENSL